MALINCPECGKEISDKAKSCPHCGYESVLNRTVCGNFGEIGCLFITIVVVLLIAGWWFMRKAMSGY